MSDGSGGNPSWIITAIVAVVGALGGAYGNVFLARRRVGMDEAKSLSQSEREFRLDILGQLKEIREQLSACERERLDCAEREVKTHAQIEALQDEIRDLKARLPQHELPLSAALTAKGA